MFYSRPELPKLGLDLAHVDGGLGRPTQYRGRTSDGRPIVLGYDRGRLFVATEDGGKNLGQELFSAQIGPRFNGDMLLEQICDLAGLTLRGEKPLLDSATWRSAAERNWVLDWSGETTYWVGDLQVTEEGGRNLAAALKHEFSDLRILEVHWDYSSRDGKRRYVPRRSVSQCHRAALFGFGADEAKLARMLARDHIPLAELDEVFAHHVDFQFEWDLPVDQLGTSLPGSGIELPGLSLAGSLETQFKTGDARGQDYTDRLLRVLQGCFSGWIEEIDLATGETTAVKRAAWHSHDLRDWCAAAPNRFLAMQKDAAGRQVGIRACNSPA
jgi:hypothetical protein